jgi:hypothetical protein
LKAAQRDQALGEGGCFIIFALAGSARRLTQPGIQFADTWENLIEGRGIARQVRQNLHDHVVAGKLRDISCELALAESVVERKRSRR